MAAILACLLLTALAPLPARAAGTVAVDVGHGLWDSGAISARGATEFDFNLNLARVLRPVLEARGLTVQPVNFDGEIESLQARVDAAAGSDFLLSIHHDSVASFKLTAWNWMGEDLDFADEDRGFALFISHRNPRLEESRACASAMGRALRARGFVPATHHGTTAAGTPRPWADEENGVRFYDTLFVISHGAMPSVLFEAGGLKHRDEELALRDRSRQQAMAQGLAEGLAVCLGEPLKAEGQLPGPRN